MQSKDRKPAAKMERRPSTPGIYKRGSRYVVVWHHRGRQHKKAFRTLAEAREAQNQVRQHGGSAPTTRATFEDYALEWLETYSGRTGRGIGGTTIASYRQAVERYAIPHFGSIRLAEIEPPDVRRFVRRLEGAGLAPSSVAKTVAPLRAMLATAHEDGVIRSNPASAVRVSRRRREESFEEEKAKAMTRVELCAVLEECPEQWRTFFELLAHTGLRISEALGLDWSDVKFGATPQIEVRRQFYRGELGRLKTPDARRDLPLSPGMAQRLWVLAPANGEGPVFHTRTGNRYSDRNVRRVLDAAADRAGVGWVSFHSFRHTCASLLFDAGKNVAQVAAWLGHSDPAFTLRTYVHLMDQGLGDAAFLDAQVGNRLATEDPASTANEEPASVTEVAG